jgi:primosomal protein N' (replication factor Y) (superfamily II helicase)
MQKMEEKYFLQIAPLFLHILKPYLVYSFHKALPVGTYVEICVRRKKTYGIVVGHENIKPSFQTLSLELLDIPSLEQKQIILMKRIAEYYHCSLGKVASLFFMLNTFTPLKLLEEKIILSKSQQKFLKRNTDLVDNQYLKVLNKEQQCAFDTFVQEYENKKRYFLLHGITGSGKTEVYLHIAYKNYKEDKQTLLLVPEIFLTSQLVSYFNHIFGNRISVLHSSLTKKEKYIEHQRIRRGESSVIIGSRSSLFASFKNLETIILDEEHELISYKNNESPRYSAKKIALFYSDIYNIPVIFSSATPSLESYYASSKNLFTLLQITERAL